VQLRSIWCTVITQSVYSLVRWTDDTRYGEVTAFFGAVNFAKFRLERTKKKIQFTCEKTVAWFVMAANFGNPLKNKLYRLESLVRTSQRTLCFLNSVHARALTVHINCVVMNFSVLRSWKEVPRMLWKMVIKTTRSPLAPFSVF